MALFGPLSEGNFQCKMTTIAANRGQLRTSTLSPRLRSPHLDFPDHEEGCENLEFSGAPDPGRYWLSRSALAAENRESRTARFPKSRAGNRQSFFNEILRSTKTSGSGVKWNRGKSTQNRQSESHLSPLSIFSCDRGIARF